MHRTHAQNCTEHKLNKHITKAKTRTEHKLTNLQNTSYKKTHITRAQNWTEHKLKQTHDMCWKVNTQQNESSCPAMCSWFCGDAAMCLEWPSEAPAGSNAEGGVHKPAAEAQGVNHFGFKSHRRHEHAQAHWCEGLLANGLRSLQMASRASKWDTDPPYGFLALQIASQSSKWLPKRSLAETKRLMRSIKHSPKSVHAATTKYKKYVSSTASNDGVMETKLKCRKLHIQQHPIWQASYLTTNMIIIEIQIVLSSRKFVK